MPAINKESNESMPAKNKKCNESMTAVKYKDVSINAQQT